MNKPCRACYQTKNVYGYPLALGIANYIDAVDHTAVGNDDHAVCASAPGGCTGHVAITDVFEAFVLRTLEDQKSEQTV